MLTWHPVPDDYELPQWLKERLAVLTITPLGMGAHTSVEGVGTIHHWNDNIDYVAHVPAEHADMWKELPYILLKEESYANT